MKDKISNLHILAKNLTKTTDRSIATINFLSVVCIVIVLAAFVVQYNRSNESYFYASLTEKSVPMLPLKEINVSPGTLLNWCMVAVTNAYTIDFLNYEKSLERISEFFTQNGYKQFKNSLNASGRLKDIIDNKLIASAVVVDSPVIINEGKLGNSYMWNIQLPIAITYQGESVEVYKQWLAVNLLVKKVPTSEAKKGIGIEKITDKIVTQNY